MKKKRTNKKKVDLTTLVNQKVECKGCKKGIKMCHRRSCVGTVADLKKIIAKGYAKRLMIDYYGSEEKGVDNIYYLCGASNGNECSKADWNPTGTCSFLINEKCEIHDIKPVLGAVACCKRDAGNFEAEREAVLATWTTPEGKELIKKWKKQVKYKEKEDDSGFSLISALELMLTH